VTASLARILSNVQRDYPKPMKWFEIGQCFRYEKPQAGRTREFIQFNADIIGESGAGADAELIALSIDTMLQIIDKIEREKPEVLTEKLAKFDLTEAEVREFIDNPENASDEFKQIEADLTARGFGDYIELDLTIVRGIRDF